MSDLTTARLDLLVARRIARIAHRDEPDNTEDRRALLREALRRTRAVIDGATAHATERTSEREEWLGLADQAEIVRADLTALMPRRDMFAVAYERSIA